MSDINNRSKIEIPNTLSCFDDFSPKNVNFRSTRNLDSEYANDEKLKFQETNFTAFNNKYENDDSKNSGSLNIMNNTVIGNYQNKRGNDKNIYDKSFCKNINNNVSHYSYISEKNNKDYKLKLRNIDFQNYMNKNQVNNIYENNSPQSRNALNIKNLNRVNGVNFNISDNKNYLFSNVNNNYIDSLYYGGDANTTNKTQISTISKKDATKLHNWLTSMNLQIYYNNFVEKGVVDIDRIISLAHDSINKLSYLDLENMGIRKPGHIFKILTRVEFDAKLIDQNLLFLVNSGMLNKNSVSNSQINLRMSEAKFVCCGLNKDTINKQEQSEKPQNLDLIGWLKYINLPYLRKNFLHNGFDSIEYLILQCYSIYLVDDALLENYLHIYNKAERRKILSQLAKDLNIINKKICNQSINLINFDLLSEYDQGEKVEGGCKGCSIF